MKKTLLFSGLFLFFLLFLSGGGWLPTDVRLDTGDTPGASRSGDPQISISGSNVYVVWQDERNGEDDIYFNYSTVYGVSWQATDIRLDTGDTPGANLSYNVSISCEGSNVYVVWNDGRNGDLDIYFNYSKDGGATWQVSDIRLDTGDSPGASLSTGPQISSGGNNVYVVWTDHRNGKPDLYFNYSTDGGATWQATALRIETGDKPGKYQSRYPQISSNGNNVYVVWQYVIPFWDDIYFNYSTDGGVTWQPSAIRLDTGDSPGASYSSTPQISSSGSNIYVVWKDARNAPSWPYDYDIYFNYSTDGGATWQASDIRLDIGDPPGTSLSQHPQICSSSSYVYVVWDDDRNNQYKYDIYFNYSTDGGTTWQSTPTRLDTGDTPGANISWHPQISSNDNNVYVVWSDERNGEYDTYFNYSINGGATWQSTDMRLGGGSQISSSSSNVYFVWSDGRNGYSDIYFNTATLPILDIKANGSDGPITITQSDPLIVTIDFDAGIQTGEEADWWVLMKTSDPKPNNWYYFDMPTRSWMLGRSPTRQGSLFDVSSKKVPKTSGLAPGTYTFYFAVDMAMNGSIDVSLAYYDKVKVTINP